MGIFGYGYLQITKKYLGNKRCYIVSRNLRKFTEILKPIWSQQHSGFFRLLKQQRLRPLNRVARFFLVDDTKTGKNVPNEDKMYHMVIEYF
jgi:hypothetical protein